MVERGQRAAEERLDGRRLQLRRRGRRDRIAGPSSPRSQQRPAGRPGAGRSGRSARHADPALASPTSHLPDRRGPRPARTDRVTGRRRRPRRRRGRGPRPDRHPAVRRRRRQHLGCRRPHPRSGLRAHADPARLRARGLVGLRDPGSADRPRPDRFRARPRYGLWRPVGPPVPARRADRGHRPQSAGAAAGARDPRPESGRDRSEARQPLRAGRGRAFRPGRLQSSVRDVPADRRSAGLPGGQS